MDKGKAVMTQGVLCISAMARLHAIMLASLMLASFSPNPKGASIPIPSVYQETLVTPKASRAVEAYWSFTARQAGRSIVLPDGRCDIMLRDNIHRPETPVAIVTGPATRAYTVTYDRGDRWLGLRMRPGNGVALWQDQIAQASDRVLRGPDSYTLVPALATLVRNSVTLDDLTKLLPQSPRDETPVDRAIDTLHAAGGRIRIYALARLIGCTPRHLNRMFRSAVGLSPKTYAQLVQFHRALRLIKTSRQSITGSAFEGGYADHAHLTRACQRYGGFVPSCVPSDLTLPTLFA